MELAELFHRYRDELKSKYGHCLLPEQRRAMWAIQNCRTGTFGELLCKCPACNTVHLHPHSCGHRSCPKCQNHTATQWLQRQDSKLLPVRYYLLTFTLPSQLRATAYQNQTAVYSAMFKAVQQTLLRVAGNSRHLGAMPGFTAVLHTNNRRLDLHPHIHVIMPGGGVDRAKRLWKQGSRKYLFPSEVLKILFRETFLACLRKKKIPYKKDLHQTRWVVNIKAAGSGKPAMKYLSKYLYKGVIQEQNILSDKDGQITFRYKDSKTKTFKTRTLAAAEFLFKVIKHTLPKRFRRSRDYGFHHGNAIKTLQKIQLILKANVEPREPKAPPKIKCPNCKGELVIIIPKFFRANFLNPNKGPPK